MKLKYILAALAVTSLGAQAATVIFSENFDSLTTGANLSGQGGWGGVVGPKVVADPGSFGFSGKIADYSAASAEETHSLSGLNNTGIVTMTIDLRINKDFSYTYWSLNKSVVSVGVEYGNLTMRGASGGTQNYDHNLTGDNVYHMIMTIDPTAFGGAGAATVNFAQYTAENTLGTYTTAFSNVQLELNVVGKALSDNTSMTLRMHGLGGGGNARADNMLMTQEIPEPSSSALLGLASLVLLRRRRKHQ